MHWRDMTAPPPIGTIYDFPTKKSHHNSHCQNSTSVLIQNESDSYKALVNFLFLKGAMTQVLLFDVKELI